MSEEKDILNIIINEGLSVRQTPFTKSSLYSIRNHKEGNEIVKIEIEVSEQRYDYIRSKYTDSLEYIFDDKNKKLKRVYSKETTIPKNAGHWMCKKVYHTSASVIWDSSKDNLASTLIESVKTYLIDKIRKGI